MNESVRSLRTMETVNSGEFAVALMESNVAWLFQTSMTVVVVRISCVYTPGAVSLNAKKSNVMSPLPFTGQAKATGAKVILWSEIGAIVAKSKVGIKAFARHSMSVNS